VHFGESSLLCLPLASPPHAAQSNLLRCAHAAWEFLSLSLSHSTHCSPTALHPQDLAQETYWQARLEAVIGQVMPAGTLILAVHEDWTGGAGNGLGTLYAYSKAKAKAAAGGADLDAMMAAGKSIALFHTAGKGTRLAPLPGAEANNKPGVKLPRVLDVGGRPTPVTILESVIQQVGIFAPKSAGRMSVYWGDQIFIPSKVVSTTSTHHADILCQLGPMVSAEVWEEKGLGQYGLIATNSEGNAAQVEKVSHATATKLLAELGDVTEVGPSMGSFSLSGPLLGCMMSEFAAELAAKTGSLDTDPHFWMPMTLPKGGYVETMVGKGETEEQCSGHWDRIDAMKSAFLAASGDGMGIFGAVDVGAEGYWWDYGQVQFYHRYNLLCCAAGEEGQYYRRFFGISEADRASTSTVAGVTLDDASCILASTVKGGAITNSVFSNVNVLHAECENCILINCTARSIKAKNALLYNVVDDSEEGIVLEDGMVRADVIMKTGEKITLHQHHPTAGRDAWKSIVHGNTMPFFGVYTANAGADVSAIEEQFNTLHGELKAKLGL
jgi:hypothetical protein